MKLDIHLIRHGTTEGNLKRWYYGSLDIPLAPQGVEEVERYVTQGIYPRPYEANYYTSGLIRAEETFALIYGDRKRTVLSDFREIDFGRFEGNSHEELKNLEEYQNWISDKTRATPPPQGESVPRFKDRVMGGLYDLIEKNSTIGAAVMVCHGGVIGTIMNMLFPESREHFIQWIPDPGRGFTLAVRDGVPRDFQEI